MPPTRHIACVGESTRNALLAEQFDSVIYPKSDWSSNGLLALPEMQAISGQRIAIFCGADGHELLAQTLRQRGAMVENLILYRRGLPKVPDLNHHLELLKAKKIDIIVCTSATSLHHLLELVGKEQHALLQSLSLVVVSERLVALAEQLNFKHVFLADNASHAGIIDALETIRNLLGNRYGGPEHSGK